MTKVAKKVIDGRSCHNLGANASLAQDAGAKCPNLVAAQWALESGWGEHESGKTTLQE